MCIRDRCYTKYPNIRVIASQAADEMLNIGDIRASIVVYAQDGGVGISCLLYTSNRFSKQRQKIWGCVKMVKRIITSVVALAV